ncbi:DUF503 domain-containing protein [Lederbergia graminis]|uniref:DUF503 domain-containing protein n=1 Tax=Lederbergia graminis TaxID=735518 RepID=A0ABW0LCV7_9BACI
MIGYVECEITIFHAQSLKEKRAVLQRVIMRVKQKYNIAVSEIGHQDMWNITKIALVTVSSSKKQCERELLNALKFMDSFPEWERIETNFEWL